jgi:hypothetical protein
MANNNVSLERSLEINSPDYLHRCTKCGILKPNTEYSPSPNNRVINSRGRNFVTSCKSCRNTYSSSKEVLERKRLAAPISRQKNRINVIFWSSVTNAKKRNLEHTISILDLKALFEDQLGLCYYTGKPMLRDIRDISSNDDSVSIDRVDSSKGYTKENIVLCRWVINRMKNDIPFDIFLKLISEINTKFNMS